MSTASGPQPPKIVARKPVAQAEADGSELLDGDSYTAERYQRVDLCERDLRHTTFTECAFVGTGLTGTDLTGAHLVDSDLSEIDAAQVKAPRSRWRHSTLTRSRLGAVEAYESNLDGLVVADTKVSYLNARSAIWSDVLLRGCVIDELDLVGAQLTRVRFDGCRIGSLDLSHTSCRDVDLRTAEVREIAGLTGLRGCTITPEQLTDLSGALAEQLGIFVVDASSAGGPGPS